MPSLRSSVPDQKDIFYGSGPLDPYLDFTHPDSNPDPTHLPSIVNENKLLKHHITDEKFS